MSQSISCKWSEYDCKFNATDSGFCKQHRVRGILLQEATAKGVRICDDAKRACRNITQNNKLKCEKCLTKIREKEKQQRVKRKESGNTCLDCGIHIEKAIEGVKGDKIMRCEKCYDNTRKAELNRKGRERNRGTENRLNPINVVKTYMRSAGEKNREFDLSVEEITKLITQDCRFCGKKCEETEVHGVDRTNSQIGYLSPNTATACSTCNYMKRDMTNRDFAKAIIEVYNHFAKDYLENENSEDEEQLQTSPSYSLKPRQIVSLYSEGKLNDFITLCEKDNRSAAFIDKLKEASGTPMTNDAFNLFLKQALQAETNTKILTLTNERKRVPLKEIAALLANGKPKTAARLYTQVHGPTKSIVDDFTDLSKKWNTLSEDQRMKNLDILRIKYNNARANGSNIVDESDEITEIEETPILQNPSPPAEKDKEILQWKVSNIWSAFQVGKEENYKAYLEEDETIKSIPDWDTRWESFRNSVKSANKEEAEEYIKKFILMLRLKRQQQMPSQKVDHFREDKLIWDTADVLKAFTEGKIYAFKTYMEKKNEEDSEDKSWKKTWDTFVSSLTENEKKEPIIKKFFNSQATKRYRRNKSKD
jgi:hypothetical protein